MDCADKVWRFAQFLSVFQVGFYEGKFSREKVSSKIDGTRWDLPWYRISRLWYNLQMNSFAKYSNLAPRYSTYNELVETEKQYVRCRTFCSFQTTIQNISCMSDFLVIIRSLKDSKNKFEQVKLRFFVKQFYWLYVLHRPDETKDNI